MKKRWIGLLSLLLLGGACGYLLFGHREHFQAEELLPADTLALISIPDTQATRQRFAETALGKIWNEPKVQEFLKQPLARLHNLSTPRPGLPGILQGILRLAGTARGGIFLACTDFSISPSLDLEAVVGFDPGDHRREAEKKLEDLVTRCRIEYPEASWEEKKFESIPYHLWTLSKKVKIAFARVGNFFLFSRGEEPLRQAILRARRERKDTLANLPSFNAYRSMENDPDALVFLNLHPLTDRLKPLMDLQPDLRERAGSLLPFQSFLRVTTIKEGGFETRSRTILAPEQRDEMRNSIFKKCERRSLVATGPDTLLYAAMSMDWKAWFNLLKDKLDSQNRVLLQKALGKILKELPMDSFDALEGIFGQMGAETALLVDWKENHPPSPSLLLEVRDPQKMELALETFFKTFKFLWTEANHPSFSVDPSWAVIFLSSHSEGLFRQISGKGLGDQPDFKALESRFPGNYYFFAYCDQKRLFERLYPLVGISADFAFKISPKARDDFDRSKLPPAETISRHLFSSVDILGLDETGSHHFSFGPVDLAGLLLGSLDLMNPEETSSP